MSFIAAGAVVLSVGMGVAKAIKGGADKRKAKKENEAAKVEMEKAMDKYRNMDTSNPYLNMENTMEDLTVNTQAADMANEQSQIGMADTLGKMNQAAGGSGIAALAQAMANQSQIANQKASANIATQEKANQTAERTEASRIQGLEIEGEKYSRKLKGSIANAELQLASGNVAGTADAINAAQGDIDAGINQVGSAAGTYAAGVS
jgi:hypothetical protein